ncbi:MAG: DUF4926 domain-containing protein [Verrucomicrobiales bacterium]|nr:DUF4926 domain-containing protein [Verrucomicrobiales bacterium]
MKVINELDPLALTCDLPEYGLVRGDVGTAVLVHDNGAAFEVEFVGYDGHTVALLTLERAQVRPLPKHDIPHHVLTFPNLANTSNSYCWVSENEITTNNCNGSVVGFGDTNGRRACRRTRRRR